MKNEELLDFNMLMKRGGNTCQRCEHKYVFHVMDRIEGICWFSMCYCEEFIPSDNLDYVEWLAAKRELI